MSFAPETDTSKGGKIDSGVTVDTSPETQETVSPEKIKLLLHQSEVRNRAKKKYEKKRYSEDSDYRARKISDNIQAARRRFEEDPVYADKVRAYNREYIARKRAEAKNNL